MTQRTTTSSSSSSGCGCVSIVFGILTIWALWFGLSTPWGVLNIDIFPPAIRLAK